MSRDPDHRWQTRVDQVVDHLRRDPGGNHQLYHVAELVDASPFHFHRIFRMLTGETLATASRRVRLERAATLMRSWPDRPLGMIALEAGFESHSEFSRAFKRWFGIAPSRWDRRSRLSAVHNPDDSDWTGPSIQELIAQDAGGPVRAERVLLPAVRLAYVRVSKPYAAGSLERGWHKLQQWMARHNIRLAASGLMGMSWDDIDSTPLDRIRYDLAIEVPEDAPVLPQVGYHHLPAMAALSAHAEGNLSRVARVWDHLYRVSLPASRCDPANWPAQERYREIPDFGRSDAWNLDCVIPLL